MDETSFASLHRSRQETQRLPVKIHRIRRWREKGLRMHKPHIKDILAVRGDSERSVTML